MSGHDFRPWLYFLNLERDFIATTAFVEPHDANAMAFSDKYAGLLLLIGSEVDVVAKLLCREEASSAFASKITEYQQVITARFPGMHSIAIEIPRYGMTRTPWAAWSADVPNSPPWWKAYNAVKHDRIVNREQANQQHVIDAICGLLALNLYLYRTVSLLEPYPDLLAYNFPAHLVSAISSKALSGV